MKKRVFLGCHPSRQGMHETNIYGQMSLHSVRMEMRCYEVRLLADGQYKYQGATVWKQVTLTVA